MNSSHERWLAEQIPVWEQEGIVSAEVGEKLRARYADALRTDRLTAGQMALGGVGALLIGLGLIAVIGFNWEDFSRPVRLSFAFAPMLLTQVLSFVILRREDRAPGWLREVSAVLQALAATAGLAIVAQIYNMGGTWEAFLLACCLVSLPLIWAMRSHLVAMLYLAGTATWAVTSSEWHHSEFWWQDARLYPLLLAGVLPLWPGFHKPRPVLGVSLRTVATLSAAFGLMAATYCAIHHASAEDRWSGWGYFWSCSLVAAILLLVPLNAAGVAESTRRKPQVVFGTLFLLVFGMSATFARGDVGSILRVVGVAWVICLLAVTLILFGVAARSGRWAVVVLGSLVVTPLLGALAGAAGAGFWMSSIATLHVAAVGVGLILLDFSGWKSVPRLGAALLCALIIARMSDSQLSLLTKGLAFIVIGIGFIAFNFYLSARARRRAVS
ncbi:MAG: DUF2157 domain-containing protein [Verrucomicrobiales bacterium]|nr:DUF2157 domain-containing protein [Verrucomicrobiales bacterium]MCP5558760.1 DUF2157 domain-containing protein [Verrucomicrobiaceae bacterium]